MGGLPLRDEDEYYDWLGRFEELLDNNEILSSIIKEYHRKCDDQELKLIMLAFRKSYHFKHFEQVLITLLRTNIN